MTSNPGKVSSSRYLSKAIIIETDASYIVQLQMYLLNPQYNVPLPSVIAGPLVSRNLLCVM